jgi:hypothetical protein
VRDGEVVIVGVFVVVSEGVMVQVAVSLASLVSVNKIACLKAVLVASRLAVSEL